MSTNWLSLPDGDPPPHRVEYQYSPAMMRLLHAGGGLQHCLDQAANHNGEPPTCTQGPNGTWVASWPDDPSSSGFGGGFVLLVVLVVAVGIAITVWKVSTARRLATESGMSPGQATEKTLLTDNGLDATYLAANLRPRAETPATPMAAPDPAAASKSAAERLTELASLRDQGMITQAEYDERRASIIDAI